ncbi:MAG: sigma-70 family RNA polymerase sigma factor, partial [Planctomycetes bacterium]|nr:sigma-70 family RNA polymerase sigma factor [Planctomycetota bacterium]
FYAWLVSLARGVIGNRAEYLEAKGRGKIRRIESLVDGGSDRMPFIDGISVSSLAARREDIVGLESALAALDPLQRKIVEQTVLMGATLSEVAAETGLPRSTVFDRLGSAMAELRRFTSNPRSSPKDP